MRLPSGYDHVELNRRMVDGVVMAMATPFYGGRETRVIRIVCRRPKHGQCRYFEAFTLGGRVIQIEDAYPGK